MIWGEGIPIYIGMIFSSVLCALFDWTIFTWKLKRIVSSMHDQAIPSGNNCPCALPNDTQPAFFVQLVSIENSLSQVVAVLNDQTAWMEWPRIDTSHSPTISQCSHVKVWMRLKKATCWVACIGTFYFWVKGAFFHFSCNRFCWFLFCDCKIEKQWSQRMHSP